MSAAEIRGVWGTVVLPIVDGDQIDVSSLQEMVGELISAGLDGVYTHGTAGEFYSLTEAEVDLVNELVAKRCEDSAVPFQLGASHPCPVTVLQRATRAAELRPGAIQVTAPDWLPASHDELIAFFSRVAERVAPVPLVLYNPPHAKRVLDLPALARLREEVPQIVGFKVGDGDASWYATLRRLLADASVFIPGHHMATGMRSGASGSYSNIACLSPAGAKHWFDLAMADVEAASELERRILGFLQEYILPFSSQGYSNAALDKLMAAIGGWANVGTMMRWPYRGIPDHEVVALSKAVRRALPELFDSRASG